MDDYELLLDLGYKPVYVVEALARFLAKYDHAEDFVGLIANAEELDWAAISGYGVYYVDRETAAQVLADLVEAIALLDFWEEVKN